MEWKTGQEADRLYFPTSGLVSCMASTSKGEQLEIYAAGSLDIIGLLRTADDSWHAKVQIPGKAASIGREEFKQLLPRLEQLRKVFCQYFSFIMAQLARHVSCVSFHPISARLCSWLATAMDLAQTTDLTCTQQCIADALGARRATVTVELGVLQRKQVVRCTRGQIQVLDRNALRALACECFSFVRLDRLLATTASA